MEVNVDDCPAHMVEGVAITGLGFMFGITLIIEADENAIEHKALF